MSLTDRIDPRPPKKIYRWDLDKTYLQTEFDTLRQLVRTAMQKAHEKKAVPGAAALIRELRAVPGIGDWTAQVIAMRALAWPDAWPAADIGLMNALGTRKPKELTAIAEPWRPWRAYAVMRLWHELETSI